TWPPIPPTAKSGYRTIRVTRCLCLHRSRHWGAARSKQGRDDIGQRGLELCRSCRDKERIGSLAHAVPWQVGVVNGPTAYCLECLRYTEDAYVQFESPVVTMSN